MAGEIQLNSTTMATESSGSITAQLDTIRPNTTNGSLVLQGDSSDAGVTGLTIDSSGNATFAQTISGGTIGSGVVFPAGVIIDVELYDETTSSGALTATAGFGTERSITLNSGQKVLINIFGGALENREDSPSTPFAAVQYDTSSLTSTSGSFKNGSSTFIDIRAAGGGSQHRIQVGAGAKLLYTAGSNLTLYFRPAVVVSSGTCNWHSDSNRPIQLGVYKIQ